MKRVLIGIAVVAVVFGAAFLLKGNIFNSTGIPASPQANNQTQPQAAPSGTTGLTYATPASMQAPPLGAYQLGSVDLGDGPVPLLTIPLDTWGGYAALFAANGGVNPSKQSLFYRYGHFGVQLVHVEDAQDQLKGYAAGQYPVIWAQMDSIPILYDAFKVDKHAIPKVLGVFDWSNGGDGIIAKSFVRTPADLRGKTILTSSNSPYAFFLLWYLAQYGITGNDVKVVWVSDGDKALDLFKNNSEIAAWVTWSPYLQDALNAKSQNYVQGSRLLINSRDANQLIADLYVIRNDLYQDRPDIAAGLLAGISAGVDQINPRTFDTMASFYGISASDAKVMLNDVHLSNFPENQMFFDANNDVGAVKIFDLAQEYYKQLGSLPGSASYNPESVLTTKALATVANSGAFTGQKNSFKTAATFDTSDLDSQRVALTNNVQLYFDPNATEFNPKSNNPDIISNMKRLAKVAEQAKFLSTTAIKLDGYLYTSAAEIAAAKAKGINEFSKQASEAKSFSKKRAEWVKNILVSVYGLSPDRIVTDGGGWDNPINDKDPASNRRVEISFISSQ